MILRGLDPDEERIEARRTARLAADPESSAEIAVEDWGYNYYAFPKALGVFYRADAQTEGELHVGYASDATLMVEWLENESVAHFFLDNPGEQDGGDWYVRF